MEIKLLRDVPNMEAIFLHLLHLLSHFYRTQVVFLN